MSDQTSRDASGKSLTDHPWPSVPVDTAVLTVDPRLGLAVLEVRRPQGADWALPGTFLHEGETLTDAVDRPLRDKANVRGLHPRQLHVFDNPTRDDRGWVLSVAHLQVVRPEQLADRFAETTRLVSTDAPGRLPFDHADIIKLAVDDVRSRYRDKPDPDGLLGDEFTLRELRIAHEVIAAEPLQRDTFRRAMESQLVATGATSISGRGRPAELFRRAE
ncbi:NUDIX domain-containing protein [Mycolicibacterium sp. ND9-15]|uniref:NUDIX hydrolase n=1 Tax=Mycolicibacterium sp. ND9-15 TaxID=3042320 RepID=UPI002DDBB5CB|nr:NUDIX domain-containing protein [Mycolicibacterium sp. ND9-15]WSE57770.1 NUDIX domain-containing protein [Mycolicibacterium sp. ND9-15]